jgi:hypothetical protein
MSNFRKKAQTFTLGLLLGIVIAGTFFILRLDNYFKELNVYKNFTKAFLYRQSASPEKTDKAEETTTTKINNKKLSEQFSTKNTSVKKHEMATDSIAVADSILQSGDFSDNIVIRKDELLNIRTIELKNLDARESMSHADSLLEKVSEIKDDRNNYRNQSMKIEFWKSPLNYKGYKLSKYNVILYGLTDTENLKIYTLDGILYMKNASAVYKLDYNADFKPYERVTDEMITSSLK